MKKSVLAMLLYAATSIHMFAEFLFWLKKLQRLQRRLQMRIMEL